jgi:TIR domain/Tetratricopeptide repeat
MSDTDVVPDFFISHADEDAPWAEWIAGVLEEAGYRVLGAWDFRAGENRVLKTSEALARCRHTIGVLSPNYLSSEMATGTSAYYLSPDGKERSFIPVRVADCEMPPPWAPLIPIDLRDADEETARARLVEGLAGRVERGAGRRYPGKAARRARFPHAEAVAFELRGHRPDPHFVGRDDLLAEIYRALRAGRPTSAVQVLAGLWGLGKTRLAIEYAHRYAAAYDIFWWIRAEDPATLKGDVAGLAHALGLPFDRDDQALPAVRQELSRRGDWLLVFDNAEDPETIFPLLPDRHTGHVLITSQRRDWPQAETNPVDVLAPEAATEYLRHRGRVADAGVALELAEALGCLLLALAQAASVIRDGFSAHDYVRLLGGRSTELFGEGTPPDYGRTLEATWRLSFDRVADRSPAGVALLRLAAFLAAEAIPLDRLAPVDEMPAELVEATSGPFPRLRATSALAEFSLAETGDGLLSVHRMVQTLARSELGPDEPVWAGLALAMIAASFPRDVADPVSWPACESLLGHAIVSAGHARRLDVRPDATAMVLNQVARYLRARGRLDRAAEIADQAMATVSRAPESAVAYLDCRNTQGLILLAQGDHNAAHAAQEEVYTARGRILGARPRRHPARGPRSGGDAVPAGLL